MFYLVPACVWGHFSPENRPHRYPGGHPGNLGIATEDRGSDPLLIRGTGRAWRVHNAKERALDSKLMELASQEARQVVSAHRIRSHRSLLPRFLAVADITAFIASFAVAQLLVGPGGVGSLAGRGMAVLIVLVIPVWLALAAAHGLYAHDEQRIDHSTPDDALTVFYLTTAGVAAFFAAVQLTGVEHPRLGRFVVFWALSITGVLIGRAVARAVHLRRHHRVSQALIVDAGDVGQRIAAKLRSHPEYGIDVAGFVDDRRHQLDDRVSDVPILGDTSELATIVRETGVDRVIMGFTETSSEREIQLVDHMRELGLCVDVVPRLFEALGPGAYVHAVEGLPLIGTRPLVLDPARLALKRAFDLIVSSLAVLFLAPVLFLVAAIVKLDSRGPVFYRHERLGRLGHRISVMKFRTMRTEYCRGEAYGGDGAEERFQQLLQDPELRRQFADSYKLERDPRVTRVGGFLRRTSLDELPQLFNVIRGDLSLVGPRAITPGELHRYGRRAKSLLAIQPGITGYWQINGRSNVSYQERIWLDMAYIDDWSVALDLLILAKTFRVILSSRGAY
jgi:exopolysaccharide biosynthesis polyprenyl glycosylphosphotransferase